MSSTVNLIVTFALYCCPNMPTGTPPAKKTRKTSLVRRAYLKIEPLIIGAVCSGIVKGVQVFYNIHPELWLPSLGIGAVALLLSSSQALTLAVRLVVVRFLSLVGLLPKTHYEQALGASVQAFIDRLKE
jgi:hypothetical protein